MEQPSSVPTTASKTGSQTVSSAAPIETPAVPEPTTDGECPYLSSGVVAESNGQLVRKVRLSQDQPNPACFFYANATEVQLSVWVYKGDAKAAKAIVDRAAPIAKSNPATAPEGWTGGSLTSADGAVYAVAKGATAVVVTSNQEQTIKARRITETVVTNLKLG
jgi:ATP/maltotriose-dependent transcriptional regulator MalT